MLHLLHLKKKLTKVLSADVSLSAPDLEKKGADKKSTKQENIRTLMQANEKIHAYIREGKRPDFSEKEKTQLLALADDWQKNFLADVPTETVDGEETDTARQYSLQQQFYRLLHTLVKDKHQKSQQLRSQLIANFVRDNANHTEHPDYLKLSSQMCWHAVAYCTYKSGAINKQDYKKLSLITATDFDNMISIHDTPVPDADTMKNVPQGSILGFIDHSGSTPKLIHTMISTGNGFAAGNKNACIGIGAPSGWEMLNLSHDLRWLQDETGFNAYPTDNKTRKIMAYYRTL